MGKRLSLEIMRKELKLNPEFANDFSKMKISAETANKLAGITDEDYKDGLSYKKH